MLVGGRRKDVPQRVAPAVFAEQRREFPGEQTVRYSKYADHHVYSSIVSRIFL
jgi:hypothetical protein